MTPPELAPAPIAELAPAPGGGLIRRVLAAVSRRFARAPRAPAPPAAAPGMVVFADVDGVLLDGATHDPSEGRAALERLRGGRAHLVLTTGKTFGEVAPLWEELRLDAPLAVEAGTAVYFPRELFPALPAGVRSKASGRFRVVEVGPRRAEVVAALGECARDAGAVLQGFAAMSVAEVAGVTGLPRELAARAMQRAHSEPFVLRGGDPALLEAALVGRSLRMTRGSRLYHAHGPADKGTAARLVSSCYAAALGSRAVTVGIGHAPDDAALLAAVDRAFALPGAGGAYASGLLRTGAIPVEAAGPRGFALAVEALVESS